MSDPSLELIQDLSPSSSKQSSEKGAEKKSANFSNKPIKRKKNKNLRSVRLLTLAVLALFIFIPFALTGIVVYTSYNTSILRKEYESKLILTEKDVTALKDQDEAFQLKQDFLEKSFFNFEYKAKLQKQPKAQAQQQSKKEKAEPTPSPNEKQIDKHAPKTKYVDRRCQIMHATVYGEFKPIEPEGESYLHDIGQWKCLCCLPGEFGLKSGERKLRLQIHTRGLYLIYVKIALGAMPTKDHVRFQLSVDGEEPAWRSCALYGDRYVTCIMTGHRVLRAETDITLEVKSGVKLNIVSKLSRIEIVKIMNVKERK